MKVFILLWVFVFSTVVNASSANQQGAIFANSMNNSTVNGMGKGLDPNTIPGYQGTNVPQKNLYGSGLKIEDQAQAQATVDDTAVFVNDADRSRPQFQMDTQTDPLFKRHDEIKEKANGLSESYSGCVDLPVGNEDVTKYQEETCLVQGKQDTINYNCTKTLEVSCTNDNAGQPNPYKEDDFNISGDAGMAFSSNGWDEFYYGSRSSNNRYGNCTWFENRIRFYVDDVKNITAFKLLGVAYDDWMFVWVNGHVGFQGIGGSTYSGFDLGWKFPGTYTCEKKGIRAFNFDVDARPKLRKGWNTIYIRHLVGGGGNAWLKFKLMRKYGCNTKDTMSYVCDTGEKHVQQHLRSSSCISGKATRLINNVEVTRNCWKWNQSYQRLSEPYYIEDPFCKELEDAGCGQISSKCLKKNSVFCETQERTYSCPYEDSARHVSLCGDQLICPDGECTSDYGQEPGDATEDFKKAATSMEVAKEIIADFDHEELNVFTGEAMKCDKAKTGYNNCCKDSGWGQGIGIASCSSAEKKLGLAKEAKRTVYVGNYCSSDSFLGCLERRYVHCAYPSKLGRIVVQQGKAQLGMNFGSAKSPNCAGFTLQQLESLDFNQMDLSEFYSDVMDRAAGGSTPDGATISEQIKNKLQAKYPEVESQP